MNDCDRLIGALPQSLARKTRIEVLGPAEVPVLLAHPDWKRPAGTMLWFHGRTVSKELDPGRYSRWVRAGLAVCAVDLPGHGQRDDGRGRDPARSLEVLEQAVGEIDGIVSALKAYEGGVFDTGRLGIGGMSLGGMVTLRRLCDEHPFSRALLESTTGALGELYSGRAGVEWPVAHDPVQVARLDPIKHLESFRPIPILALHSLADTVVPWAAQALFLDRLRAHYEVSGADPEMIRVKTWETTGAPGEHAGFGKMSNEAKNLGTEFLARGLVGLQHGERQEDRANRD